MFNVLANGTGLYRAARGGWGEGGGGYGRVSPLYDSVPTLGSFVPPPRVTSLSLLIRFGKPFFNCPRAIVSRALVT